MKGLRLKIVYLIMKIATIIVTRSKSCHVKTMHTILRMKLKCIELGYDNEILFVNDNPFDKAEAIRKCIPTHDRILFIDFGISMDENSISQIFGTREGIGFLVFPAVLEGINWDMFKEKVKAESSEPIEQMGLEFDTTVSNKISPDIYTVDKTSSACWIMNTKSVLKKIKDKSGKYTVRPQMSTMFADFKTKGVKIHAYTAAKLTMTYNHECVGNILNASGIKSN